MYETRALPDGYKTFLFFFSSENANYTQYAFEKLFQATIPMPYRYRVE
jgi:hypothetical protein